MQQRPSDDLNKPILVRHPVKTIIDVVETCFFSPGGLRKMKNMNRIELPRLKGYFLKTDLQPSDERRLLPAPHHSTRRPTDQEEELAHEQPGRTGAYFVSLENSSELTQRKSLAMTAVS